VKPDFKTTICISIFSLRVWYFLYFLSLHLFIAFLHSTSSIYDYNDGAKLGAITKHKMGRCMSLYLQYHSPSLHYTPFPNPSSLPSQKQNKLTLHPQGLRGLASLSVVLTHLFRSFDPDLFLPTSSEHAPPRFPQYPVIRVISQGRIGAAIFSLITGFVCALKPFRQIGAGQRDVALRGIARSVANRGWGLWCRFRWLRWGFGEFVSESFLGGFGGVLVLVIVLECFEAFFFLFSKSSWF